MSLSIQECIAELQELLDAGADPSTPVCVSVDLSNTDLVRPVEMVVQLLNPIRAGFVALAEDCMLYDGFGHDESAENAEA